MLIISQQKLSSLLQVLLHPHCNGSLTFLLEQEYMSMNGKRLGLCQFTNAMIDKDVKTIVQSRYNLLSVRIFRDPF